MFVRRCLLAGTRRVWDLRAKTRGGGDIGSDHSGGSQPDYVESDALRDADLPHTNASKTGLMSQATPGR
jgi:hypothetical protein